MALGAMRGQVAELQVVLAGISQQLLTEQAMRRTDMQVRAPSMCLCVCACACVCVCARVFACHGALRVLGEA